MTAIVVEKVTINDLTGANLVSSFVTLRDACPKSEFQEIFIGACVQSQRVMFFFKVLTAAMKSM